MAKAFDIGRLGERTAQKHLRSEGYKILHNNNRQSHKEIDIIAKNKEYITFVEVKTRSVDDDLYSAYGSPACAVDHRKQQNIIAGARSYLLRNPTSLQVRMDVIEVYVKKGTKNVIKINHIENAYFAR